MCALILDQAPVTSFYLHHCPQSLSPDTCSERLGLGACRCWCGGTRSAHDRCRAQRLPAQACSGKSLCSLLVRKQTEDLILAVGAWERGGGTREPSVSVPGHRLLRGGPSSGSAEGEQVRQGWVSAVGRWVGGRGAVQQKQGLHEGRGALGRRGAAGGRGPRGSTQGRAGCGRDACLQGPGLRSPPHLRPVLSPQR